MTPIPQNRNNLETTISYKFKDHRHLNQALIHRSYLNENRHSGLVSNERYEFLGDAILELWISDQLFKIFPDFNEGDLTNLRSLIVCTQNLAKVAQSINLGQHILLSRGEESHGGRENQSILADTFESLIGAVYLDTGITSVFDFLSTHLQNSIDTISKQKVFKDPKSLFQEIAQAQKGTTPHYQTLEECGPDHQKKFKVGVYLGQDLIATGEGNSKQKAEETAAIAATQILNK